MKALLLTCLLAAGLCGSGSAESILSEDFEGSVFPSGWTQNSVVLKQTYAHGGTNSAQFNSGSDGLISPPLTNAQTLTVWTYVTSTNARCIVETSTNAVGPWTEVDGSPFPDNDDEWIFHEISLAFPNVLYVQFRKSGSSGYLYIDDVSADDELAGNSAPILTAIGDQAVVVSNELSFVVSATDANTGDDIVLSATNLPSGATFNTITNSGGSVSRTFIWTEAAPTGTYSVTFTADDGTTNDSETITITVNEPPVLPDSVGFNFRTNTTLYTALDGKPGPVTYTNEGLVAIFTASTGTMNRTTSGFGLFPNDTDAFDVGEWIDITFDIPIVLTNVDVSSWNAGNDQATIYVNGTSNGVITSTGDHAFDIIVSTGQVLRIESTDGVVSNGWSLDSITVRTSTNTPPESNALPVLESIGSKSSATGDSLNFTVIATDTDGDDIILSATNLPSGAEFNTITNAGSVTNTFNWASPTAGVYNVTFMADDGITNASETITITVTNSPPAPVWSVYYNLPYQSSSGILYPDQFVIRNALVDRINELESGDSAILATFSFSANEGAGVIINAMDEALDRGAMISFIAENDPYVFTVYGGTNSLWTLYNRSTNPLNLVVDNSTSGITHNKLGLFDYGGTNQWVFTASWNFTEGASVEQWNIAFEARSPSLYAVYTNETAELLAGHFHDDSDKSHAHDGSTFLLDGSWGTNFARFSPPPDENTVENDITNQIAQAQSEIVFALNKLTRTPIRDALIAAADRGVIIKGVMPRSDTDPGGDSDDIYSYLTNSANYATSNTVQMLTAYVKADYSALDSGEQNLIHTKYMVIDPQSTHAVVIHGSANWTYSALVDNNQNDENTLFLRHNGIAAEFHDHFLRVTGTGSYSAGDATLVSWDFADTNRVADGGIPANLSSTIARDSSQTNYDYYNNETLSTIGWDDGTGTKYWETQFVTTNYTDIKVSSRQLASSTGPADFKLQYKTSAGGVYADVSNGAVHVPNGGNGLLTRVLLPEVCNDQATVFLRWLLTSTTSAGGGIIGSTGVGRIDDIVITGTTYVPPVTIDPPVLLLTFDGSQPGGLVSIAWSTNNGSAFNVWTNANLLNTNGWGDASWTVFQDGDSYKATNSLGNEPVLFYKLESE